MAAVLKDVPCYSTCCVWFSEKSELSMTILCNISMVAIYSMCTWFAFVGVTMYSFDMSLLEIMLVSIEGALMNIMYLVPFFLTNNIFIKPHVLYFPNSRR